VVAGIAFKNRGNDYFDEYEKTGSPARQKELFGEAQKYDHLSLVGWGIGEVGFFAGFFLLIKEQPRGFVPNPDTPAAGTPPAGVSVKYTKHF
jgi:hypothetical protein